jgi:SpoVK/Ycf46/Vps4 family AAA+-type ATPase
MRCSDIEKELSPLSRLWILRILVKLDGYKKFLNFDRRTFYYEKDELASLLGLPDPPSSEKDINGKRARRQILQQLEALLDDAEAHAPKQSFSNLLRNNIQALSEHIGLSETDRHLLEFAAALKSDSIISDAADYLGELNLRKLVHVLSVILDIPGNDISASLQSNSPLTQSGLLTVDSRHRYHLSSKIEVLSNDFAEQVSFMPLNLPSLMHEFITESSKAKLTLEDYPHLSSFIDVLRPYMRQAIDNGRKGVNVLLYGAPGTGKSELARAIAQELNCTLFESSSEDSSGNARDGESRLKAFRFVQCLFARQKNTLLAFDEAEDIFRGGFFSLSIADRHKGWLNHMLENNPVPTIWLTNSIDSLDAAFARRFDLVQEIPIPPKPIREKILNDAAGGMLSASAVKRLAESEHLSPAVVQRSAAVVKAIQDDLPESPDKVMETLIANTMTAQGLKRIPKKDPARLPDVYDPAFINTDIDMAELAAGVKQSRSARICLYGAPGTGKTAFGRWLAEQLEAPLHIKRASDILSMWVGQAEKNIAHAFRQAEMENAVLLIDEVDSFLRDRKNAQRSWEVSQVNEMLTQMEAFPGVFIASTNLMDGLDEASLRRFDLKVKFQYLRPEQALELFRRHCAGLGLADDDESSTLIRSLTNLAPGDFAAVIRQSRFHPLKTAGDFARALQNECAIKKNGAKQPIGFRY